jgi:hypothetical protein
MICYMEGVRVKLRILYTEMSADHYPTTEKYLLGDG